MSYDAVIFDNDGVLTVPTARDVFRSTVERAFYDFGVLVPKQGYVDALVNGDAADVERICDDYTIDPAEFWSIRERAAIEAQHAELQAGAKPLYDDVDALRSLSASLGIVSNNQQETVENVVRVFGLGDLFESVHGRAPTLEGLDRCKPDPYLLAAAVDELEAANPLYVGDSECDVVAAAELGIDSAFVRRAHREGYVLDREPTYEVSDLADLIELVEAGSGAGAAAARSD